MNALLGGRRSASGPFAGEGYMGAVRALQRTPPASDNVLA